MKKGFTLIEILITISIVSVMSLLGIKNLVAYLNLYKKESRHTLEEFYVNQAFIFIEEQFDENQYIELFTNNQNKNEIKITSNDISNYIKLKGNKLVIAYYESDSIYTNNIMYDVKNFTVEAVNNIMYVKIMTKYGKEYERCFAIRKKQDLSLYISY